MNTRPDNDTIKLVACAAGAVISLLVTLAALVGSSPVAILFWFSATVYLGSMTVQLHKKSKM